MKIDKIEHETIFFDNGNKLTYYHQQDCCEHVYADFEHMQIVTRINDNFISSTELDFSEDLVSNIGYIKDLGFTITDKNGIRLFISCYNSQNGYYSSELELKYIVNNDDRDIVTTIDISDCVKDNIY